MKVKYGKNYIPYIKYMKWKIKFMFEATNQFLSLVLCFNMSQLYLVHAKYPPDLEFSAKWVHQKKYPSGDVISNLQQISGFSSDIQKPQKGTCTKIPEICIYIYPNLANGKYSIYIVR